MKHFLLLIYLCSQWSSCATNNLPAPFNLFVESQNFEHVLRWSPGLGTPPGTTYKIFRRDKKGDPVLLNETTKTRQRLKLRPKEKLKIWVQASHKRLNSTMASITFTPFEETVIGPPALSLVGCGNCLQLNITLDEIVKDVFGNSISFDVDWKTVDTPSKRISTTNSNYKLENLQAGVEFCVRVLTKIPTNPKTQWSGWQCAFTSKPEPNGVTAAVAVTSGLLVVIGLLAMFFTLGLMYTGYLCKPKNPLTISQAAIVPSRYFFIPEVVTINHIAVLSDTEEREKMHRPNTNHSRENSNPVDNMEEEEEGEEEEVGISNYMGNAMSLSSDSSSSTTRPQYEPGANKEVHSGGLSLKGAVVGNEEALVSMEEFDGKALGETLGEHLKVISSLDNDGQENEEENKETRGNINLFSVTLGALKRDDDKVEEEEEEEEEEESDTGRYIFTNQERSANLHTPVHYMLGELSAMNTPTESRGHAHRDP
ncbi:hypothetical protein DPEC_G00137800 [Dallia pectoralis]|uniref:Uncharacterized protein n=1 Tax=Dallia pectoralis TaxID=75939 RepID=A0ACC2GMA3_DALPE|nr:hypothetical protein DPEC_G00137800 [Dallia pectoralis]